MTETVEKCLEIYFRIESVLASAYFSRVWQVAPVTLLYLDELLNNSFPLFIFFLLLYLFFGNECIWLNVLRQQTSSLHRSLSYVYKWATKLVIHEWLHVVGFLSTLIRVFSSVPNPSRLPRRIGTGSLSILRLRYIPHGHQNDLIFQK